jgi:hypothetical protein
MPTSSGLVSYWPGDGNARDVVGVNDAASAAGTEDLKFAPGKLGQAFHFTGGQMGIAGTAGIGELQQFTMALWVKLESMPQGEGRSFLGRGEKARLRYDGENGPQQLHFFAKKMTGEMCHVRVNGALQTGVFHHIVGTYDGSIMRLYLDGSEVGECETTGMLMTGDDDSVTFGQDDFTGLIDEIQIYNRPLSASEIRTLAQQAKVTMPAFSVTVDQAPLDSDKGDYVWASADGIADLQRFSIALWVKLDSMHPDQIQRFVTLGNKATLRYDGGINTQQLHFHMIMTDGTWSHIRADDVLSTGVFHHVVGTYDGHAMRLFLDGAQVGTCKPSGLSVQTNYVSLSNSDEPLCGLLDDVQIFDRVLDAREIQELHSSSDATIPIDGTGPIAWWRLDETSGTTAHDSVGSNHGTVHGATWTDGKFGGALFFDGGDSATVQ